MTSAPTTPSSDRIFYTLTDEAPLLATASLLPIVKTFLSAAGIEVKECDISLAARILGQFPEYLRADQRVPDSLKELAQLTKEFGTNIIKLPNISASASQLMAAIKELQSQGYALPDYPETAKTEEEKSVKARYARCIGSSVNPVLREGNSDRRAPKAVKEYARKHPHKMGAWSQASRSHVSHMRSGDFYHSEKSITLDRARDVRMELVTPEGKTIVLRQNIPLLAGEIVDSMFLSKKALVAFYDQEIKDAYETGVLFSLHLKATMMKVSDPIMFGHCIKTFYRDVLAKYDPVFKDLGINFNNGMGSLYEKLGQLTPAEQTEIQRDIQACHQLRPELAMVDTSKAITNFHSPNDVIVDASMPAMIRNGGKMWGRDGQLKDVKAVIPDSTFARIYQEVINFCKSNGALDPKTMGTVPNVGLMAQQAEEYGSHNKTFEVPESGEANVVDSKTGELLLTQRVEAGDIWRVCQTKDAAILDWVKLATTRARNSAMPVVFWLDPYRPHEAQLITKVNAYLKTLNTDGLDIQIMSQVRAMRYTLERVSRGLDTISATGNILRDYLTDLFPILEVGTSAKMLSVVPLMAGGGLYETGAGGSAPKHVQQLVDENHLRWDSLGEFLALAVSLEDMGLKTNNPRAKLLAKTLDLATGKLLNNDKGPRATVGQLDNRGSHFYLALYWAQALSQQTEDLAIGEAFKPLAQALTDHENTIADELLAMQGHPVDLGGYYRPDISKTSAVMRPSLIFNTLLQGFGNKAMH